MDYEAQVCSRCGNLVSVCSDPTLDWHPNTTTCWASASVEWGWRVLRKKHSAEEPSPDALHPLDGVRIYASQEQPEVDDFALVAANEGNAADRQSDDEQ